MKLAATAKRHGVVLASAGVLAAGGAFAAAAPAGAADHGSQIRNYPLQQVDIGGAGVSGSTKTGQSEIQGHSIGGWNIDGDAVTGHGGDNESEVKAGTLAWEDLSADAQAKIKSLVGGGDGGGDVSALKFNVNDDGHLVVTYPDGTSDDLGDVQGPKGEQGEPGQDGVSGYEVTNTEVRWHAGGGNESSIDCADGKVALGGGYAMSGTANGDAAGVHVGANEPVYSGGAATGWHVSGSAEGEVNVKAWVICAAVQP